MLMPLAELAKHDGFEVTFASGLQTDRHGQPAGGVFLKDMAGYDVIVGQRFNSPAGLRVWRGARTPYSRLVYETDDDVFSIQMENWSAFHLYQREEIRDAVAHCMEVADAVTVTTPHLAEVMSEYSANVKILPNYVPGFVLGLEREPRGRPRIGWIGGASHGRDIHLMIPSAQRFLRRFPGWDFLFLGTDYRESLKASADRVSYGGWAHVTDDPRKYYQSIDFDIGLAPLLESEFAKSKCVDSSMRISTDQGVLEAGMIEPGMSVWLDGWREVQAVEHQLRKAGMRITTARGLQVTVTPEHRLMDSHGSWRQARDLNPGDRLKLVQEECPDLPVQRMPWPADGRVTRSGPAHPMAFLDATEGPSVAITEAWGRILGLFTGDGNFSGKTAITFSCDGQDSDLIKMLVTDLESVGFRATTEQVTTWGGEVLRRRSVHVASAHLSRFLCGVGAGQPHSELGQRWERTLRVPEVIFRSPLQVRAAFLAGLFEADGHVTSSSMALTTKSEDLARDVQRLLWSIGVPSITRHRNGPQRSPYADRTYWQVWLRLQETKLFAERAGFLSDRKQAKLASIVQRVYDPRGLNGILPVTWTDEIVVVEPADVHPVDIQVEGEAFSLAGILSHNSGLKAVEYMSRGIPVIASDCLAYRGIVEHGVTGFLVRTDHEWLKAMSDLASDDGLREKMGAAAREAAREWTIEKNWQKWADAYTSLFPSRVPGA